MVFCYESSTKIHNILFEHHYELADHLIYREVLIFVVRFTALRFTMTSASPAAKRLQILPMNQYCPMTDNI
jgi:hypothetical protein